MAHQFHVAHSANVRGAGIIAGGPYYCAEGKLTQGMHECTATGYYIGPPIAPQGKDASDAAIKMADDSVKATLSGDYNIDDPEELLQDKVILIHGIKDSLLREGVMDALYQYYQRINVRFGQPPKTDKLVYLKTLPITHAMPTDNFIGLPVKKNGGPGKVGDCQASGTPFLNVCTPQDCAETCAKKDLSCSKQCVAEVDAAGVILTHIYGPPDPKTHIPGPLNPRCQKNQDRPDIPLCSEIKVKDWGRFNIPPTVEMNCQRSYGNFDPRCQWLQERLFTFDQSEAAHDLVNRYLWNKGYIFVPRQCEEHIDKKAKPCKLHIVFHGCLQGGGLGGHLIEQAIYSMGWTHFVENAGYNEWANTNDIVVLYPQASTGIMTPDIQHINPQGCWDFWGYTDSNYHTKDGRQISAIWRMVKLLVPDLN